MPDEINVPQRATSRRPTQRQPEADDSMDAEASNEEQAKRATQEGVPSDGGNRGTGGPAGSLGPPDPEENRLEVQALLGQIEGLLKTIMDEGEHWCPPDLLDSLHAAYDELLFKFSALHAGLNSGDYDQDLIKSGLAGAALNSKRLGLWARAKELLSAVKKRDVGKILDLVRGVTRWILVPLETLAGVIPVGGVALKELVLTIQAAAEQMKEMRTTNGR